VVGAAQADRVITPAKTLAERTTQPKGQPKSQPKSAANNKQKGAAGKGPAGKNATAAKGNGKPKRQGRNARPAKKTAEELDSEMADYFVSTGNNENAGAAAPAPAAAAAAGDAPMEDEIM
jgi:THO complex subunit 4